MSKTVLFGDKIIIRDPYYEGDSHVHACVSKVSKQCEEYFGFHRNEIEIKYRAGSKSIASFSLSYKEIEYGKLLMYEDVPFVIGHEYAHAYQQKHEILKAFGGFFEPSYYLFEGKEFHFERKLYSPEEYNNFPWERDAHQRSLDFCRHYGYSTDTSFIENVKKLANLT